ncbi:serine/threonine-protein kinase [Spirillospora sp. CA-255316]
MREPPGPDDPETIGRYRVTARLGRGGMGTVYLGEADDAPPVAIKLINPEYAADAAFRARFRREVGAARRVRSHSTAPVLEASLDEDPLYVAIEYIEGPDLESAVAERGPLRGSSLEQFAVGVATALRAIHEAGLVHRDLKPSNVLLSPTGPRVIDFGISRAVDEATRITAHGQIVGTPAYIAPELIDGRPLTPAADVFSWGGVIAFAGTGRPPFDGRSLHEVLNKVGSHPPDLDGLDPLLRDVVERALNKRPEMRPTVDEMLTGFAASLGGEPGGKTKVADPPTRILPIGPGPVPGPGPSMPGGTGPPVPPTTRPPAPPTTRPPLPRPPVYPGGATPPPYAPRRRRSPLRVLTGLLVGAVALVAVVYGMSFTPAIWRTIGDRVEAGQSARASASPTPSVDKRFIGRWSGTVTEYRADGEPRTKYRMVLTLRSGGVGGTVGTTRYPSLECSGELRLETATPTRLKARERIVSGLSKCVSVPVQFTRRKDGALDYEALTGAVHSKGRLTRQK